MEIITFHQSFMAYFYCFTMSIIALTDAASSTKIEELLEKGTKQLVAGKFAEAISFYSDAINEDPDNFLSYYKRATAFLASGKTKSSLPDLDKVLELKTDYYPAYKTRGNVHIKLGELDKAKKDFESYMSTDATSSKSSLDKIQQLRSDYTEVKALYDHGSYSECLPLLKNLMETITLDKQLLDWRATCYLRMGDLQSGIQDLRNSVHLVNDNRQGLLRISKLMYDNGLAVQSLEEIRECLRLDQDDKDCHNHYKKVKKVSKAITDAQDALESHQYDVCVKKSEQLIKLEPNIQSYLDQAETLLCQCTSRGGQLKAVEYCLRATERDSSSTDLKLDLANAYVNMQDYDEAIKVYQKILETDRNNRNAHEGMEKAQRLRKNLSKRDYYQILGVTRSASKKEITKAYRKLAAEWHPDRFEPKDKKMAEKRFIDITDAKEVLTNPEKKKQFDMGFDPLDPEQQSGGGPQGAHHFHFQGGSGGPFGGFQFNGFNPFENGDGHFEFHFG